MLASAGRPIITFHRPETKSAWVRRSHSHKPSFAPSAASVSRSSLRLSAWSAPVRSVMSCHSSVTPPATGRILTLKIRGPDGRWERNVRELPAGAVRQRFLEGLRELGLGERGHRAGEETPQRALARAVDEAFQRIVPERHPSVVVEHGHALIQRVDHLAAAVVVFEPVQAGAVRAIGAIEQDRGDRHQLPELVDHELDEPHGEGGAEKIGRTVGGDRHRPRRLNGGLVQERRDHFRRNALHETVARSGPAAIGAACHGQVNGAVAAPSAP